MAYQTDHAGSILLTRPSRTPHQSKVELTRVDIGSRVALYMDLGRPVRKRFPRRVPLLGRVPRYFPFILCYLGSYLHPLKATLSLEHRVIHWTHG